MLIKKGVLSTGIIDKGMSIEWVIEKGRVFLARGGYKRV